MLLIEVMSEHQLITPESAPGDLRSLGPFLNDDGIIIVGSRLNPIKGGGLRTPY